MNGCGKNFSALVFLLLIPAAISRCALWQTVVDETSFSSVAAFQSSWSYNYPWGTDHNGSARMNATNVSVANGMVTLTSSLTNDYEGVSGSSPHLTIRYNSGTFYLKTPITIDSQYPVWDISGQFRVPTQTGAWPAFWMTGANSWPPESDFMEFKGSDGCNQNTYDGSWQSQITTVSTASTTWHAYRVVACLENSTNVDFHYYIDGQLKSEQTSTTFVGAPCWLIIDYQMEGSSGSPGPSYTTHTYVTNVVVNRLLASGGGPLANGPCKLVAAGSGQVLEVGNQETANGSTLDQWPYNAGLNQQWILTYVRAPDAYSIIGRQSGRALQPSGAGTNNGAVIELMDFTNGNNQAWAVSAAPGGYYTVMNANSGKLLEVSDNSTNKFAPVDQWSSAATTLPLVNGKKSTATRFVLTSSHGIPGNAYSWWASTNLLAPVSDWASVATVLMDSNGDSAYTQQLSPGPPQWFFALKMQSTGGVANQQWSFLSP